jgi:hypothetical protein
MKVKSLLITSLLAASFGAAAVEVGVSTGMDRQFNSNVTSLTISQGISNGLQVSGVVSTSANNYTALGANVGKNFAIGKVVITPQVGAQLIKANSATELADGLVGTVGIQAALPITPSLKATLLGEQKVDFNNTGFNGRTLTAGLRYSF